MNSSPLDAKELVRQAVNIVDLVGEHVELRRQGRNFVGRCLWHDDSRPSLNVNPDRQSWRCWVCDIGGDVFSFVMKRENVDFREALEMLADRAGVELAPPDAAKPQPGGPGDKRALLAACEWAAQQFHRCLNQAPEAEPARAYLRGRGLSAASIARFRLGFAPDRWDWLLGAARLAGHSPAVLERVGLLRPRDEGGGWYDFFRGRVMFPICDVQGRTIAFGGRVLPELADRPGGKYVNSPETPLYAKNRELYALHLARDACKQAGQLVVMEGYTDVIMAHQHGVENAVAVCGTALGSGHMTVIRRFTDSIALVLDGDAAGRRRANEVLELFVENQVDLRILTLPNGLDPCDFIGTPEEGPKEGRGVDAFRDLLRQAPDALEHKLSAVTNGLVAADHTHAAAQAAEQVLSTLAKGGAAAGDVTGAAILREQSILSRLSRSLGIAEQGLRDRLTSLRRAGARRPLTPTTPDDDTAPEPHGGPADRLSPAEAELLAVAMANPETAKHVIASVGPDDLASPTAQRLLRLVADAVEVEGTADAGVLLRITDDERLKAAVVALDEDNHAKGGADPAARAEAILSHYRRRHEDALQKRKRQALRGTPTGDPQELEALESFFATLKSRQAGPLSTDGEGA